MQSAVPHHVSVERSLKRPPLTPFPHAFRSDQLQAWQQDSIVAEHPFPATVPHEKITSGNCSVSRTDDQLWTGVEDFHELAGPMSGTFRVPSSTALRSTENPSNHDLALSLDVVDIKEEPQDDYEPTLGFEAGHSHENAGSAKTNEMHVHFGEGVKRSNSGNAKRVRKSRPEQIFVPRHEGPTHFLWLPSPTSPNRHFRDIVAERCGSSGKMYKVVWRDSWVHESRLPDIADVRKMHVVKYGKNWDVLPDIAL